MIFKAACVQLSCSDDLDANIRTAEALVAQAIAQGAQFIALPENAFLMEDHGKKQYRAAQTAEQHPGVAMCRLLAKQHAVWILVGSIGAPDPVAEGKIYNMSVLIDAEGNILRQYPKIHLFDVDLGNGESYRESNRVSGGCEGVLAQLPWAKLGLSICYDIRFPHLYRGLAKAGAEILAIPAAFTKVTGEAHWEVLLRARAIENGCFVIAPAQWGEHPGKRFTYGHSMIINPWGEVIADAGHGTGIIVTDIDMEEVGKARGRIPSLNHDRDYSIGSLA